MQELRFRVLAYEVHFTWEQSLRGAGFATKQSPSMQGIASLRPARPMRGSARNDIRPQPETRPADSYS